MRTLIAGGGTGGHLTPALAVAEGLRAADEPVLLVGRRGGVAESLARSAGVPLETIDMRGLDLSSPGSVAGFGMRLPSAVARARKLIRSFRADVVVGAAGYVCVPVVLAARSLSVPVVLMEQNALPGRAVRSLARFAQVVATSFEMTADHLQGRRAVFTGNPVREEVVRLRETSMHPEPRSVLVMGGSQGARTVNRATVHCIERLLGAHEGLSVTHVTGERDFAEVSAAHEAMQPGLSGRYRVLPFVDGIAELIAGSDLVVMRAGGSSLAECTVIGRAMVLVPYPHAGDHQRHNAKPYVDCGAAVAIPDSEWNGERAVKEIEKVIDDTNLWGAMSKASLAAGRPQATQAVIDLIHEAAA